MEFKTALFTVDWRRVLVLLCLAIALGISLLAYDLGKLHGVPELAELRIEYAELDKLYSEVSDDNETLRRQVAIFERSVEIDRQAIKDVRSEFSEHEEELLALREEIEFYRGIVSPDEVKPGLRVYRFEVSTGNEPDEYQYDLVLTQFKHNDRYVKGTVHWEITGRQGEEPQVLALTDVTDGKRSMLNFKFRYFQDLTGYVRLPEKFEVDTVLLRVKSAAKGSSTVEHTLKWPSAKELRQGE